MVAARQYFENLPTLSDNIEFYFDHIPLPGYGWMFPTSTTTANIGAGYFGKKHSSPRTLLENFYRDHPRMREFLKEAKPLSALKGYPLRVDFHESTLMVEGALGVGEAVGLVNPFTGEGIDYALESGWVAADCIAAAGGFTVDHLSNYPRRLKDQFQRYFALITFMRNMFYNKFMLNRLFGRGAHNAFIRETLMEICIAEGDPLRAFSPKMLWEVLKP
jgi:flavin-dependent dehydrogenase